MQEEFDPGFWEPGNLESAWKVVNIKKSFQWEGEDWLLPAVYLFEEGFVLDLCNKISVKEMEAFFRKWPREKRERKLSPKEMEEMEAQSPVSFHFFIEEIVINGQKAYESRSTCFVWHPLDMEQDMLSPEGEEMVDTYGLSRDWAWRFNRFFFSWPEGMKKEITSLQISLKEPVTGCPCLQEFTTTVGMEEQRIQVTHPVSLENCELWIKSCEGKVCSPFSEEKDGEYPSCYQVISHEMVSGASSKEYYVRDTSPGDSPRIHGGAASVSILTDSPKEAFSSLYFQPPQTIRWYVDFLIKGKRPLTLKVLP